MGDGTRVEMCWETEKTSQCPKYPALHQSHFSIPEQARAQMEPFIAAIFAAISLAACARRHYVPYVALVGQEPK